MSEALAARPETAEMQDAAARLALESGLVAGRLAGLLERLPAARTTQLGEEAQFLRSMFETVARARPLSAWGRDPRERRPLDAPHPLDRLADALGLSPVDLDVVLLAGLPEE